MCNIINAFWCVFISIATNHIGDKHMVTKYIILKVLFHNIKLERN